MIHMGQGRMAPLTEAVSGPESNPIFKDLEGDTVNDDVSPGARLDPANPHLGLRRWTSASGSVRLAYLDTQGYRMTA
jgi:hypothetical protein